MVPGYEFDPDNPRHWWFGDCPGGELPWCWHYEYLRDCQKAIQTVQKWRLEVCPPTNRSELIEFFTGNPIERAWPEWPNRPYLEIPPTVRTERLKVLRELGTPLRDFVANQSREVKAKFPIYDWSKSDLALIEDFRVWLKSNRPKDSAVETRGNAGLTRRLMNRLKALGAYRLCMAMPSMNQAIQHAITFGHPLYRDQPQLSKICRQVADDLERLDSTYVF